MKRDRAKLANDIVRTFHYNTRSSSRHGISNINRVETSDAIVESTSPRVRRRRKKVSDLLPIDLIMEILKLLPAKTLARFLCVSKLWASIIRSRDFMKLFLTESSNRPGRLFFTFRREDKCFLFSSLQSQNPGEASLATYLFTHSAYQHTNNSCSLHGLICYGTASASTLVIYNSSTSRSTTLPEIDPQSFILKHFLGYDPIDGVYKVLCLTGPRTVLQKKRVRLQKKPVAAAGPVLQVLTLGNGNPWKIIEDPISHYPIYSQICINGVLYYEVFADTDLKEAAVMSFDVRSEKFDLIKRPRDADYPHGCFSTMTRFEGKLAIAPGNISANGGMVLWVLEDAVKHEWVKKVFVLPNSWTNLAQCSLTYLRFINVTDAGELMLAPIALFFPPYHVLYYDPKRNSVRKVVIEGITEHRGGKLLHCTEGLPCFLFHLFSSQVESLLFL